MLGYKTRDLHFLKASVLMFRTGMDSEVEFISFFYGITKVPPAKKIMCAFTDLPTGPTPSLKYARGVQLHTADMMLGSTRGSPVVHRSPLALCVFPSARQRKYVRNP